MLYKQIWIVILLCSALPAWAQQITGRVVEVHHMEEEKHREPLPGVNIIWLGTETGTATDMEGNFTIAPVAGSNQLVFSFIGYQNDTITIDDKTDLGDIEMRPGQELGAVTVEGRKGPTTISGFKPINQEYLSSDEFKKAACCNLSESFETNATVDVSYSDGVTGAKEIRMLGLDGAYTLFTIENIPGIRGLGRTYGMNYIPGTWLESVQISKGVGSVANGYESITGQINLELKKPGESPRFFVNLYENHMGRTEVGFDLAKKFNPRMSSMLFAHGSLMRTEVDNNGDGFVDLPMTRQLNVFNRWDLSLSPNWEMRFGVRGLYEDRRAGQTAFDEGTAPEDQPFYGVKLKTQRMEGFLKTGYIFKNGIERSMGWQNNFSYHRQDGFYGRKYYDGTNTTYYSNLMFQTGINSTMHNLRAGASFMYDDYYETFDDVVIDRTEAVPGVYAEYTFNYLSTFSLVGGMRLDYHNLFGLFYSPRLHLRYNPKELTTLRLSVGRGYRVTNIFADNTNILVSSRDVVIQEDLQPEVAWNFGVNFTQKFNIKNREGVVNIDFYHTEFENQVILDLDQDRYKSIFYNLSDGRSYSNAVQAEIQMEVIRGLDMKMAYKYNDVKTTYNGVLRRQVLVPSHQGLFNVGYTTRKETWMFDATVQLNGRSRLPDNHENAPAHNHPDGYSPVYPVLNAQVTKKWKTVDLYVGVENATNYRQPVPILGASEPFSNNFDASSIWGPVMGTVGYIGLRLTIE